MTHKELNKQAFVFIIISFSLCLTAINLFGQEPSKLKIPSTPSTCEYIKNELDYSLINGKEIKDSYIIFIFRLGKGETSKLLNQLRIKFIKNYLDFRDPKFSRIVFTEGVKNKGLGKIEIYVGGLLAGQLSMKRNKSGWDSCIE